MATIGDTTRPAFAYDSATDTWIPVGVGPHAHTPAAIGAIASSIVTTKGDLIVGTSSGVVDRLGVGSDNQVLSASSSATTGLAWVAPSGMTLISTTTLSGATTTISSIPQTYKTLFAVITGVTNATANGLFRININGGATNNFYAGVYFQQGATVAVYGGGYDYAVAGQGNWLRTDAANSLVFTLPNYTASNIKSYDFYGAYVQTGGGQYAFTSAGYNLDAGGCNSLIFSNTGGNFSTGTVKLYGVN